ncbi:AAA-like domain-containing protein [Nostoc sp. CENA67]|uniref:AAA-like domain-containing protein n=1 Tax=Amazonocrinis nigriterrae CENA67 TaxID=2794033 RepID=A0A8J7HL49_9NOST|nr:AAA-like domain-containing protein [Amazonocrinis nigriterrae]MBH8561611.1 AAA-like domain-containing protein [Amazonocrinis nigriterrae CENA67]
MNFNLDEAIRIANQAVFTKESRKLTDVEILVFKGAWHRQEYDQIAAQNQYTTSYISQDVAPKLWKLLTESLGEKVKKSNFKEALKRYWEQQIEFREILPEKAPINLENREVIYNVSHVDLNSAKAQKPTDSLTIQQKPSPLVHDIYVERPPIESICYKTLLQPGSLIRLKAPRLMGKTSLMTRVLAQVASEGYRTASLSFGLIDKRTHLTNLNKFLRWFCLNLSRELGLPSQLDEYWDEEEMGTKVSCTTYFEEYLLVHADSPLVLCLDDVDLLFPYPEIYEDFFGLLRSWYEKARTRQTWKKLRLVLVYGTDVYIQLNINQSPFNVGLPIELTDFTNFQLQDLAQQHGMVVDSAELETLMNLVGGHPYLLELALAHLKSHPDITLKELLEQATTEAGIYGHHLRDFLLNLQEHPELTLAFKKVVTSTTPVRLESVQTYQLQSMGLVKLIGNEVEPRCYLYRQYFSERLGT